MYTATSRKLVGKSARYNPERYCRWFWVRCSSKKFERRAQEAMDVCLRVLKESNTKDVLTATVSGTVYWSYPKFTFRHCRVHIFADNLSQNSCTHKSHYGSWYTVFPSVLLNIIINCKSSQSYLNLLKFTVRWRWEGMKRGGGWGWWKFCPLPTIQRSINFSTLAFNKALSNLAISLF